MTAHNRFSRVGPMHRSSELAERRLNNLSVRAQHWRPGAFAGGLYADFADAQAALGSMDAAQVAYARERLERLAARVGITVPRIDDITGSATWRCAGVVRALIDPWHLAKVIGALFPQPSVQARVTVSAARTVEIWVAMSSSDAPTMLRRIDAVLTRTPVRRVVGNCLVLSLRVD